MKAGGTYYKEAQEREKKERSGFIRRRLQQREKVFQELDERRQVNPHTELRIVGRKGKALRAPPGTDAQAYATKNLVPCPAEPTTLIDRFDGRALIDPIPKGGWEGSGDPQPHNLNGDWGERSGGAPRAREPPTGRDKAEASLAAFEAYKDLLKYSREGVPEDSAVEMAALKFDTRMEWEREQEEKRRDRHNMPGLPPAVVSYNAIYIESETEEEDDASDTESPAAGAGTRGKGKAEAGRTLSEDEVDSVARQYGVHMYWMLRAIEERERGIKVCDTVATTLLSSCALLCVRVCVMPTQTHTLIHTHTHTHTRQHCYRHVHLCVCPCV